MPEARTACSAPRPAEAYPFERKEQNIQEMSVEFNNFIFYDFNFEGAAPR
jgi:hypothetical protein